MDILDAVRKIRMRGARHINFDQIKVALETRDAAPLVFTDNQKTDEFIEIELSALVDRLCHKSYLVNMTGTSYRIKETKKLIEKNNV